ncbi:MAG: cysteine desulfurase family protein [Acidimicrobiia bacterium]
MPQSITPSGGDTEVYLDHAASAPLRPEARAAMLDWLGGRYGNPSGAHRVARAARRAIDEARDAVAEGLGCRPGEVIFTGGGTEADNLAVLGAHAARPGPVLCSAIEHEAVLAPVAQVGGRHVPVDPAGRIDLEALGDAVGPDTSLVSVMAANNEVGTVQPVAAAAEVVRSRSPGAVVHTDAVQAAPWLDLAVVAADADLVSVSAHKLGGPQGVGALVVRQGTALAPRALGGGQERELRSGTHNVAGIVGFAAALTAARVQREAEVGRITGLRDRLAAGLLRAVPGAVDTVRRRPVAGDPVERLPGTLHLCVPGVESEALLFLLDQAGVCASAASACASGAQQASHVLAAMGVPAGEARGSLRLSLGWTTTDADVDAALDAIPAAVARLRGAAA